MVWQIGHMGAYISKTAKILYCTSGHLMVLEQYFKHRQAPLVLFGGNHPKHGMRRLEHTLSTLEDRLTLFSWAVVKSSQAIKRSTRPWMTLQAKSASQAAVIYSSVSKLFKNLSNYKRSKATSSENKSNDVLGQL